MKPASSLGATLNAIQRGGRAQAIAPPKKRRQITATMPQVGNPFAGLQGVLGKALKGQPY